MLEYSEQNRQWMQMALDLAEKGRGTTAPNPLVGALVVKNGQVIGKGYHERAGQPHAEVFALEEAGEEAYGADLYVTLEPCCHYGRTPPCTERILEAGILRVFVALTDPNPKVAGGGIAALRAAGVLVEVGLRGDQARRQNDVFLTNIGKQRPFVLWKNAATLDGRTAAKNGHSQWITGPEARAEVHRLRSQLDAIVVGSGTIIADDPLLTARPLAAGMTQPLRVLLDRQGRIASDAAVLQDASSPVLWFTEQEGMETSGLGRHVEVVHANPGTVQPLWVLAYLYAAGVTSILLEGGPTLVNAFWRDRLIDKIQWYVAPKLLGDDGRGALGALHCEHMSEAAALLDVHCRPVGGDWVFGGYTPWNAGLITGNEGQ